MKSMEFDEKAASWDRAELSLKTRSRPNPVVTRSRPNPDAGPVQSVKFMKSYEISGKHMKAANIDETQALPNRQYRQTCFWNNK